MRWLTEDAKLVCKHRGPVAIAPTQALVTINGRKVLVRPDPEGKTISGCPNCVPPIKPCLLTLTVKQGYSSWIQIDAQPLCLDTIKGLTDGTPPGTVEYIVQDPGQTFVDEAP